MDTPASMCREHCELREQAEWVSGWDTESLIFQKKVEFWLFNFSRFPLASPSCAVISSDVWSISASLCVFSSLTLNVHFIWGFFWGGGAFNARFLCPTRSALSKLLHNCCSIQKKKSLAYLIWKAQTCETWSWTHQKPIRSRMEQRQTRAGSISLPGWCFVLDWMAQFNLFFFFFLKEIQPWMLFRGDFEPMWWLPLQSLFCLLYCYTIWLKHSVCSFVLVLLFVFTDSFRTFNLSKIFHTVDDYVSFFYIQDRYSEFVELSSTEWWLIYFSSEQLLQMIGAYTACITAPVSF